MLHAQFGLTPEQLAIAQQNASDLEVFKQIQIFNAEQAPVSKVSLLYVVDSHGDFTQQENLTHRLAHQFFLTLDSKDKFEVLQYIQDMTEESE